MGYATAFYANRRGDYRRGGYRRGDLFGMVRGAVRGVARVAGAVLPGPLGALARGTDLALRPSAPAGTPMVPVRPGGIVPSVTAGQAARGVTRVGVSPLGTVGVAFRHTRRMNAGNAKAARRAIRRIKAVRHMLKSIEREMPKVRVGGRGSPGVITRSEARRALAS